MTCTNRDGDRSDQEPAPERATTIRCLASTWSATAAAKTAADESAARRRDRQDGRRVAEDEVAGGQSEHGDDVDEHAGERWSNAS